MRKLYTRLAANRLRHELKRLAQRPFSRQLSRECVGRRSPAAIQRISLWGAPVFTLVSWAFIASALLAASSSAYADNLKANSRPDVWSIRVDNDSFALPTSSDTNYTMGVAIRATSPGANGDHFVGSSLLLHILDTINKTAWFLPQSDSAVNDTNSSRSFILQDDAFTPTCLDTAANCAARGQPITKDRPYANLIWTGVARRTARDDYSSETSELDIGLYGTNIGNVVQTWIHERCCTNKIPQEWKTQIGDGGALTFLYKQIHDNELLYSRDLNLELRYKYGFWIGWNTWPTAGLSGKWGAFQLEFDTSYVLYNQSLQGAWGGNNSVTYAYYSDIERLIGLMHLNIDLNRLIGGSDPSRQWGLRYSQNWKTRDLKVDGEQSVHHWGGLEYWHTF